MVILVFSEIEHILAKSGGRNFFILKLKKINIAEMNEPKGHMTPYRKRRNSDTRFFFFYL